MSFIPEYLKQVVGKNLIKTTKLIDDYLQSSVIPRLDKDASLLESYFSKATRYTFDDKTNPPKKLDVLMAEKLKNKKSSTATAVENKDNDDADDKNNTSKTQKSSITFNDIKDRISVVDSDCLAHAKRLADSKISSKLPAVHNLANEYNCGGAWSIHKGSQEEYIMRSSTLPLSLWKHRRVEQDGFRAWEKGTELLGPAKDPWYPFSIYGGVYTPTVEVFALCDEEIKDRFNVSILTNAAQDLRNRNSAFPKQVWNPEITANKLRTLFFMAIENECEVLVLGAFGNGAFLCPPKETAEIYKKLIEEICAGCESVEDFPFKKVDFAIIKSKENFEAYRSVFG